MIFKCIVKTITNRKYLKYIKKTKISIQKYKNIDKIRYVPDKMLKGIRCVRPDNRKVFCTQGPRTK